MICSKCGEKLAEGDSFCKLCGGEGIESTSTQESETMIENNTETITRKPITKFNQAKIKSDTIVRVGGILCVVFLIIGIYCCYKGFDYKNNYYSSENYASLNVNAYVGGDAYNYIINGTYFTGFLTLGGASIICSIICICSTGIIYVIEDKRTRE